MIIFLFDHNNSVLIVLLCLKKCKVEYEQTHARTLMYEMFHFQYVHAFTNDLLSTFSN